MFLREKNTVFSYKQLFYILYQINRFYRWSFITLTTTVSCQMSNTGTDIQSLSSMKKKKKIVSIEIVILRRHALPIAFMHGAFCL